MANWKIHFWKYFLLHTNKKDKHVSYDKLKLLKEKLLIDYIANTNTDTGQSITLQTAMKWKPGWSTKKHNKPRDKGFVEGGFSF